MKILLLGATGRVGSAILSRALGDGHQVCALVRNPAKFQIKNDSLSIVISDVRSKEHLQFSAQGVDAVISCLSTDGADVLSSSMLHLIQTIDILRIPRLVVVSTAGILQSRTQPHLLRYESGENKRGVTNAVLEHRKMWEMLSASVINWTLVCPTFLPDGKATGQYRVEPHVLPLDGRSISVGDTAEFTYQQLFSSAYLRQRVGIAY